LVDADDPGCCVAALYLGLARDWWGYGTGDGWQFGAGAMIAVSLVSVAVGIGLRSLVRPRAERPAL
jgi:hypothetical protein